MSEGIDRTRGIFMNALLEYDRCHIWHPYAALGNPPPVRLVKLASFRNTGNWPTTHR